MSLRLLGATFAVALMSGGVASAATILLYDTGVDAAGAPPANDDAELHYSLVAAPSGGATTLRVATSANGFPIGPWVGDDAASAWIGPNSDSSLNGPVGTYDYQVTFSLAGLNPATASITGQWASDNKGVDILINGVSTGQSTNSQFSAFTPFSVISGFQTGANTLDFIVHNDGGPTGVRVEMTGTAGYAVPEPATWALMLAGFGGMGAALRRKRETIAA